MSTYDDMLDVANNADHVISVFQLDETGTAYGVKHINNKPRVSAMPYLYDIAEGNVTNHSSFSLFGYNGDVDVGTEDLISAGASYTFPAAEMQMEVVSSSANDDGSPAGFGARTVIIDYLDDAYAEKSETVTLNGTTAVATTATDIFRVNRFRVKTAANPADEDGI